MIGSPDPRIPPELQARLQLVRVLSQGSGGEVLLCQDGHLHRPVILKVSTAHAEEDEQLAKRFAREARVLSKIEHPQVVRMLDAGAFGNSRYLLFEYLEGKDFQQLLKQRGAMDWREALECTRAVADGLAAVHAMGVLHRDIKPANVMMHETRGPVLIDFGISQRVVDSSALTRTGLLVGTPEFLAPERITSGQTTPASDVYSVGIFLYYMISGRSPFLRLDLLTTLEAQVNDPPPPLEGVPEIMQQLLDKMLAKIEADRPRDGAALVAAIDRVLEATAPLSESPSRQATPWQQARRLESMSRREPRPFLQAGIALAGMIGFLAAITLAFRGGGDPVPAPTPSASPAVLVTSSTSDSLGGLEKILASRLHHRTLNQLIAETPLSIECQGFLEELESWMGGNTDRLAPILAGGEGIPEDVRTLTYERMHPLENLTHLLKDSSPLKDGVHELRSRYVSVESSALTTDPVAGDARILHPPPGGREIYLAPWGISRAACVAALRKVMSSEPRVEESLKLELDPAVYTGREWVEITVSTRCLCRGLSMVLDLDGTRRIDLWGIGPPLSLDLFARLDEVLSEGGKASPWQVYRCRLAGSWLAQSGGRLQLKVYSALARPGAAMTFVPSVWLVTSR